MQLVFESETELGRCDPDRVNGHFGDGLAEWTAFAHTTAAVTGAKGLVRIEQRCYLRSAEPVDEVRAQSWVKPEMTLEPGLGSREDTKQMVQQLHEAYVQKAREAFLEQSLFSPAACFAWSGRAA